MDLGLGNDPSMDIYQSDPSLDIDQSDLSPSGEDLSTQEESLYTLSQSTSPSLEHKDLAVLSFVDFHSKCLPAVDSQYHASLQGRKSFSLTSGGCERSPVRSEEECFVKSDNMAYKRHEIATFIHDNSIDIMYVTETWFVKVEDAKKDELARCGYTAESFPRSSGSPGGGIAIIYRDSLSKHPTIKQKFSLNHSSF
ncbi:hypothetical protein ACOMHN_048556 [Nucella lapillus]